MTLHDVREGLPRGFWCRVKGGRTIYREAGWMWRELSENTCYLSRSGDYDDRRYLPAETEIELVKEAA